MITFNPLDVIKASDINANFEELTSRADTLDTATYLVYACGTVGSGTGSGYITLSERASENITFNGSNAYTVTKAGIYTIYFQQLTLDSGTTHSLYININGVDQNRAWTKASEQKDVVVSGKYELAVNDVIRFNRSASVTSAWGSNHSQFWIEMQRGL